MAHHKSTRLVPAIQPGDAPYARNFRQGPLWVPEIASLTQSHHITDVTLSDGRRWGRHQGYQCPDLGQTVVPLEQDEQVVVPAEVVRTLEPYPLSCRILPWMSPLMWLKPWNLSKNTPRLLRKCRQHREEVTEK